MSLVESIPFCVIAAGLLGASLFSMSGCSECQSLNQSLDAQQLAIYQTIVDKRRSLSIQGLFLGLIISAIYLYYTRKTVNPFNNGCIYAGITLLVTYIYYLLMPKGTYMVQHLKTQQQLDMYAAANRKMQLNMLLGLFFGFLGLTSIPYIFR